MMNKLITLRSEFGKGLLNCIENISNLISAKPYWIIDTTIIFRPEFNECLDDYTHIISNYRILIFSNYNSPQQALEYNIIDYDHYYLLYKYSLFNYPLGNSLSNLTNLQQLTFGILINLCLIVYQIWLIW